MLRCAAASASRRILRTGWGGSEAYAGLTLSGCAGRVCAVSLRKQPGPGVHGRQVAGRSIDRAIPVALALLDEHWPALHLEADPPGAAVSEWFSRLQGVVMCSSMGHKSIGEFSRRVTPARMRGRRG